MGTEMDELQRCIGEWGDAVFGTGDDGTACAAHLILEAVELRENLDRKEAADCAILLLQFAHRRGFSLREQIERKHAVNQTRQWGVPDKDGVVRHLAGEG